jgi:aminoglycoside/choline kinase family phosphotransferase
MGTNDPGQVGAGERIDRYLRAAGLGIRPRVVPLTGDASDRRYFRVVPDQGDPLVLALHAGPIAFETLPFARVAELLQRMALPVPAILGHSDEDGIIALEDLGDVTLQGYLGAATAPERAAVYRDAVSLIAVLQRRGREFESPRYPPYRLAFDVEKLTWELEFFVEHFLVGYRGARLSDADRRALAEEWAAIAGELAAEPRVLCHRDYHSRNLMWRDGRLYVIDFQDARLGPDTYDLVSLLRDSYVELADRDLEALVAHFLERLDAPSSDAAEFRRRFDLMAVQRNLKALGTFGYQAGARGNAAYVQYMPRTLAYVRRNLERYERFAGLRARLSAHLAEIR